MCQSLSSKSFLFHFIQKPRVDLKTSDNRYHFRLKSHFYLICYYFSLSLSLPPPFFFLFLHRANKFSISNAKSKRQKKNKLDKKSNPTQHYYYYN